MLKISHQHNSVMRLTLFSREELERLPVLQYCNLINKANSY